MARFGSLAPGTKGNTYVRFGLRTAVWTPLAPVQTLPRTSTDCRGTADEPPPDATEMSFARAEEAVSERHLPSCWTTASHRARVSAFAGSLGFCRTAVCTIMSFEPGSTNINWPWMPLSTKIRLEPD